MAIAPKLIYKYEPFTLRALQNLKAQSVYFASPKSFNDPYDCALTATLDDLKSDDIEMVKQAFREDAGSPKQLIEQLDLHPTDVLREQLIKGVQASIEKERTRFLATNGVTCFSENNDNLLMWSHYGGQYKGYCLEFRTDFEPFNKLIQVQYSNTMPKINIVEVMKNKNYDTFRQLIATKSDCWSYEKGGGRYTLKQTRCLLILPAR